MRSGIAPALWPSVIFAKVHLGSVIARLSGSPLRRNRPLNISPFHDLAEVLGRELVEFLLGHICKAVYSGERVRGLASDIAEAAGGLLAFGNCFQ